MGAEIKDVTASSTSLMPEGLSASYRPVAPIRRPKRIPQTTGEAKASFNAPMPPFLPAKRILYTVNTKST